ncbi:MAG: sensor histidine kinase [Bacteroidota bacterium]
MNRAEAFILSGESDTALTTLGHLRDCLLEHNALATEAELRTRLLLVRAYLGEHQTDRATELLFELEKDSRQLGFRGIETEARLYHAQVFEGTRQLDDCREALDLAGNLIQRHDLDSLTAFWAIRKCSYFRHVGPQDSVRFYAALAFRKAQEWNRPWELAHAYTLRNDANPNVPNAELVSNLRHFVDYQLSVKNYQEAIVGYSVMGLYRGPSYAEEALADSDTIFHLLRLLAAREQVRPGLYKSAYDLRMVAFQALGQLDSALHYALLRHDANDRTLRRVNAARIAEVEAQFEDKEKARRIRDQEVQLGYERTRLWLLLVVLGMAILVVVLLVYYNRRLAGAKDRVMASLRQQILLRGELHHRVKNNLQVIISLLQVQERKIDHVATKDSLRATSERIYSIAAVHELLYPHEEMQDLSLQTYAQKLCAHAAELWPEDNKPSFQVDLSDWSFNLETLIPLGVMISELLTNSRKYYGPANHPPHISMHLREATPYLLLTYRDNGPGFPTEEMQERAGGMGNYLLRSMSRQLNGHFTTRNEDGAVTVLTFHPKQTAALGPLPAGLTV